MEALHENRLYNDDHALDLESPIEHFSVHKPMHVAAACGYPDAHDLARVFKGEMPGYSYGRPRQSDGDRA